MVGSIIGYTIIYLFACLPAILSTYGIMRLSYYFKTNKSSESENNLLETLKSKDKKIDELTSYRDKLAERCKMLSNTNDSLNEKIEELSLSLKDAKKDIDASKQSLIVLQSEVENKQCEINRLRSELSNKTKKIEKLQSDLESCNSDSKLQQDLYSSNEVLEGYIQLVTDLGSKNNELTKEIDSLKNELSKSNEGKKHRKSSTYKDTAYEFRKLYGMTDDEEQISAIKATASAFRGLRDIVNDNTEQSISDKADVTNSDSYTKNCSDCMYSVRYTLDIDIPYLQLLESSKSLLSMINIYKVVILAYQDKLKNLGEF